MSIGLLVTRGYSNGTLTGAIKDVVTRGYTLGAISLIWTPTTPDTATWTPKTPDTGIWTPITPDTAVWT